MVTSELDWVSGSQVSAISAKLLFSFQCLCVALDDSVLCNVRNPSILKLRIILYFCDTPGVGSVLPCRGRAEDDNPEDPRGEPEDVSLLLQLRVRLPQHGHARIHVRP